MASIISIDSVDSDVFFVKQLLNEPSPQRNNSPNFLNSTELSGTHVREMPTISTVGSPELDIVSLDDYSNEPTMPYRFGRPLSSIPLSLNDLNLPPNPFNILAKMVVVNHTEDGNDENYSPQSPEPYDPSPHLNTTHERQYIQQLGNAAHHNWRQHLLIGGGATTCILDLSPGWNFLLGRQTQTNISVAQSITTVTSSQAEEEVRDRNVFSTQKGSVATCLRSLWTSDSPKQGHSMSVN